MDETARLNDQLRHTFYQGGHVEYRDRLLSQVSTTALAVINFHIREAESFNQSFAQDSERREGRFDYGDCMVQWCIEYRDWVAWTMGGVIRPCTKPDSAVECYRVLVVDALIDSTDHSASDLNAV